MKISSVYIDRFAKVLANEGIELKRAKVLEIVSTAFGFHNSNEFSAAAKRGDLTPPPVTPLGKVTLPDGQTILLLQDRLANAPYGIDECFVEKVVNEERAELIGLTPYGHLASLTELSDAHFTQFTIEAAQSSLSPISDTSKALAPVEKLPEPDWLNDVASALEAGIKNDIWYDAEAFEPEEDSEAENEISEAQSSMAEAARILRLLAKGHGPIDGPTGGTKMAPDDDLNIVPPAAPVGKINTVAIEVFSATINHKHGADNLVTTSQAELDKEVAQFCEEYWDDISNIDHVPASPDGMSDREIVETYFDNHPWETLDQTQSKLTLPQAKIIDLLASAGLAKPPCQTAGIAQCPSLTCPHASEDKEFIWLTDENGDPVFADGATRAKFDRLGQTYHVDCREFLPLTEHEIEVVRHAPALQSRYSTGRMIHLQMSALYQGKKFHVLSIKEDLDQDKFVSISATITPAVTALKGHVITEIFGANDDLRELLILIPFEVATSANSIDDYFQAIDHLINGDGDPSNSVIANFDAQIWISDNAMTVHQEDFDVTFELLLMGNHLANLIHMDNEARGELRYAVKAPKSVQDWTGPFEVDIDPDDVKKLFNRNL